MLPTPHRPSRLRAALLALFVTLLWSSSWVLIKVGLTELPALTFAGLRYTLAFVCLLPFALLRTRPQPLPRRSWRQLALLGFTLYTLTQGAQFVALSSLPAQTTSLLLSFSPVVVAFLGLALLAERPSLQQGLGVALYLVGAAVFLLPITLAADQHLGIAAALVGLFANAGASVLGRRVNRQGLSPLTVTAVSMGLGGVTLLGAGLVTQGLPPLGPSTWLLLLWLAVVNTALAFTLWNRSLRTLSAMESSVINNTMLIQIALLAWLFLGEPLGLKEGVGLALAALGTLTVQLRFGRRRAHPLGPTPPHPR